MKQIKDMTIEELLGMILHCDKHLPLDRLEAKQEILSRFKKLEKLVKNDCETDTNIREIIRPTGIDVDGDSWFVPPLEDLVEKLIVENKRLKMALELMAKRLQQITLTNGTSIAATIGYFKHKADEATERR